MYVDVGNKLPNKIFYDKIFCHLKKNKKSCGDNNALYCYDPAGFFIEKMHERDCIVYK